MQQRVVEGFATVFGSLDEYLQVFHDLLLSAEIGESQWAQSVLKVFLTLGKPFFAYVKIFVHHTFYFFTFYLYLTPPPKPPPEKPPPPPKDEWPP